MPALKNARHELFAQGLASGKTAHKAYVDAGYRDGNSARQHASRLTTNGSVIERRDFIIENERRKLDITADTLAAMLLADRDLARRLDMPAAAVTAVNSLAKLFGLIEHKSLTRHEFSMHEEIIDALPERYRTIDAQAVQVGPEVGPAIAGVDKGLCFQRTNEETGRREAPPIDQPPPSSPGDPPAPPGGVKGEGVGPPDGDEDESPFLSRASYWDDVVGD